MKVTIKATTGQNAIHVQDLKPGQMFKYHNNNLIHSDIIMISSYTYQNGVDKIAVSLVTGEARQIFGDWMVDQREILTDISFSFEP
jgi:hypothetical protein